MPAVVGAVKVNSISGSAVFHIGDVFIISPYAVLKTFAGAGSFNTGDRLTVNNNQSTTITYDQDLADTNNYSIL